MPSKPKSAPQKNGKGASKANAPRRSTKDQNSSDDAIALLEADHRQVEKFFDQFEDATGDTEKRKLANAICVALKVHARLEEELFYPAAATVLGDLGLIEEAQVEHASAKDLIAQIEAGAPGEMLYDAKVKVLGEYVDHHVTEEEDEIFPEVRKSKLDLAALGARMALRKNELMTGFTVSNPILGLD